MVKGLLSQTVEMARGTLNLINGVVNMTAAICIGIGIKAQKRPTKMPLLMLFLLILRYSRGILYLSKNLFNLPLFEDFFLKAFRII